MTTIPRRQQRGGFLLLQPYRSPRAQERAPAKNNHVPRLPGKRPQLNVHTAAATSTPENPAIREIGKALCVTAARINRINATTNEGPIFSAQPECANVALRLLDVSTLRIPFQDKVTDEPLVS